MKASLFWRILFLLAMLGLGTTAGRASDLDAAKGRMAQRQGAVDALRNRGAAGENFRGFLEARGAATAADQKVIGEENADRRAVYAELAAQTNTSVEQIGRGRAQQIAAKASPGVWIQDPSGTWRQK